MNRRQVAADSHPSAEKPSLAVVPRSQGRARTAGPDADASRTQRIREAAYRLYEARGRVDGHDVDDWLAAEAAVAGESAASSARATGRAAVS